MAKRRFRMTDDEHTAWQRDGFFMREDGFSGEENGLLNRVAEEVVAGEHKSADMHSARFRRSYVAHYLSAQRSGRAARVSAPGPP